MKRTLAIAILIAVLALLILSGAVAAQGDAAKGKTLWAANNCKSCHGANGEGKYCAPRAGDGRPLDAWLKQIRTPMAVMPAYDAAHISDADITDAWAYMQTLPKPASFTPITYAAQAGDLPGWVLFNQKNCVACHGDGKAFVKARFTDQGRAVTAAEVLKQLRNPFQKMPLFNATFVTDADATEIAAFLATLVVAPAAATPAAAPLPTTGALVSPTIVLGLLIAGGLALLIAGLALASASPREMRSDRGEPDAV